MYFPRRPRVNGVWTWIMSRGKSRQISDIAIFDHRKCQPHLGGIDDSNRLQPKHARIGVRVTWHRGGVYEHLVAGPFEIPSKRFD